MATQRSDAGASERILRRHQELMRVYSASTRRSASISSDTSSVATNSTNQVSLNDLAILKQNFQFIRDDEVDAEQGETDWQARMSVRYYRQLFREYALADLSRYREGKIGLRWRTEMEVIAGKGQFSCGNKRCDKREGLHSYELLFAYVEHGERKRCLVKVRACSECARKLFYKKMMEMKRKEEKKVKKKRRLEDGVKQKAKRRRQSTPRSDLQTVDSSEASDESSANEDQETGGNIHQLCAKINAEQKAAYPVAASRQASVKDDSGFDELLP